MARGRIAENRSADIINAARSLILEEGPARMTMDAVAARAGVGKGTIFLYWPSKAKLVDATITLEVAAIFSEVLARLDDIKDEWRLSVVLRQVLNVQISCPLVNAIFRHDGDISSWDDSAPAQTLRELLPILRRHDLLTPWPNEEIAAGIEMLIFGMWRVQTTERSDAIDLPEMIERVVAAVYEVDAPPTASLKQAAIEIRKAFEKLIGTLLAKAAPSRKTTIPSLRSLKPTP